MKKIILGFILSTCCTLAASAANVAKDNISGRVTDISGHGIPGVVVSDGFEVVKTDSRGRYRITSEKANGYVFVSTPAGYEPHIEGNVPVYWKNLKSDDTEIKETVDFELRPCNNTRHAFIVTSDKHITRRNNDLRQYEKFVGDINATADSLRALGYYVVGQDLGDITWDLHWRARDMDPLKVREVEQALDMPTYHLMGNHDNNPYYNTDREAECTFEEAFGPIYYSYNMGNAHYVVLDNIFYESTGAIAPDTMGSRTFKVNFTGKVLDWLRKDLAMVGDKSAPLFVSMHAPLFNVDRSLMGYKYRLPDGEGFEKMLSDFKNVRILSGHTHVINNIPLYGGNGIEHNIPAISGTFWLTDSLSGNHLCRDGSPAGYLVCLVNDKEIEHIYYKCYDFPADYQFRAYDMNVSYVDPAGFTDKKELEKYSYGYNHPGEHNEVLINVFNYDPSWNVEVYEGDKKLSVMRLGSYDPLHVLSYNCNQLASGNKISKGALTAVTTHLFKVKAKSSKSTLTIRVTDGYGHQYVQQMERPKRFHELMW